MSEKEYREFYKKLEPLFCPALQEMVYFNADGFNHLLFKNRHKRIPAERRYKLSLLPFVCEVLLKSKSTKLRIKSKNPLVCTWSMTHEIIDHQLIPRMITVVIIRKKPAGKLHFLSVMEHNVKSRD
jgi:hypothetical protein